MHIHEGLLKTRREPGVEPGVLQSVVKVDPGGPSVPLERGGWGMAEKVKPVWEKRIWVGEQS